MNDISSASPPRRRRTGRAKYAVIAVVGVALAAFGAWKLMGNGAEEGEYLFGKVEVGDIEDLVTATGTLEPRDYVDVGAQVSGQIEKIFVEVGDVVKVGDILVKIDATQAAARVEANRASLRSSETSLLTQRNNLEKAERDYKRQQNLWAENATTREALLNAETTLINARNQIVQSEAQIAQQKANMRIEERNLQYTDITAPIDGTVLSIAVKEGQSVNASQNVPVVMKLANLNTMTVRADVSEADEPRIYKGMPVYFSTLGAGQGRRWYSEVKRIEPTPRTQQGVVLFPALFDVQNDGNNLKSGMTTQVFFVAAEARNVLTVPMAALQQGQQIARELAAKERDAASQRAAGAQPGAADGPMAATGGAATPPVSAGSAPATADPGAEAANAPRPGAGGNNPQGGNRQGGLRAGGFGGGNGGPRGGGGFGGFTPEQIEEFRRSGGMPGGMGNFRGGMGGAAAGAGRVQQRRGTVMVKKADGTLEPRQVVIGVTNRVHGQVLEGLEEGEEVVVGKRETQAAAAPAPNPLQQNQNFRGNQGFPGGGGGGFRPF